MTMENPWHASAHTLDFIKLYMRHNLVPELSEVADKRAELKACLSEFDRKERSSKDSEAQLLERRQEIIERLSGEIKRLNEDPRRYETWRPSVEDVTRLAVGLAIKHGEFKIHLVDEDQSAENAWVRDIAIKRELMHPRVGKMLHPAGSKAGTKRLVADPKVGKREAFFSPESEKSFIFDINGTLEGVFDHQLSKYYPVFGFSPQTAKVCPPIVADIDLDYRLPNAIPGVFDPESEESEDFLCRIAQVYDLTSGKLRKSIKDVLDPITAVKIFVDLSSGESIVWLSIEQAYRPYDTKRKLALGNLQREEPRTLRDAAARAAKRINANIDAGLYSDMITKVSDTPGKGGGPIHIETEYIKRRDEKGGAPLPPSLQNALSLPPQIESYMKAGLSLLDTGDSECEKD
jgi:hypothetical protein